MILKNAELRQQRKNEQQEIESAEVKTEPSPRSKEQARSFDQLDAAEFERRIDLETGEFIDADDYVADASIQGQSPIGGPKSREQ